MRSLIRALTSRTATDSTLATLGLVGGLAATLVASLAGCGSIEPVPPADPPITEPARLYMQLTLERRAITLATVSGYETAQLQATPRDARGNPMSDLPAPAFNSGDTTKLHVTSDGVMTARASTDGDSIAVIATLTVGPVTHADTAYVKVTADVPAIASLSIHPAVGDSTRWPMLVAPVAPGSNSNLLFLVAGYYPCCIDARPPVRTTIVDPGGSALDPSMLQIEYVSLDTMIASFIPRTRLVRTHRPGAVRILARALAYGDSLADTVTYTVTWPTLQDVFLMPQSTGVGVFGFKPDEFRIRPYGIVFWYNGQVDPVDVVFDDPAAAAMPPADLCLAASVLGGPSGPTACGQGNGLVPAAQINAVGVLQSAMLIRQFPTPGIYTYRSLRTGVTGRIVVTDDPT